MLWQISPSFIKSHEDEDVIKQVGYENSKSDAIHRFCDCIGACFQIWNVNMRQVHASNDQHFKHHEVKLEAVEEALGKRWHPCIFEHNWESLSFSLFYLVEIEESVNWSFLFNVSRWLSSHVLNILLHDFVHELLCVIKFRELDALWNCCVCADCSLYITVVYLVCFYLIVDLWRYRVQEVLLVIFDHLIWQEYFECLCIWVACVDSSYGGVTLLLSFQIQPQSFWTDIGCATRRFSVYVPSIQVFIENNHGNIGDWAEIHKFDICWRELQWN